MNRDYFEFGEKIDFLNISDELQITLLGRPLWEAMRERQSVDWKGSFRVSGVDRQSNSVTIQWEDSNEKQSFE